MSNLVSDRTLTSAAIRSWLDSHDCRSVAAAPDVDAALTWARGRWRSPSPRVSEIDDLGSDRLYALVRVIREDPGATAPRIGAWYHLIESADGSADLFAEKIDILCQLAYLAWRQSIRLGAPAAAWAWEERVAALAPKLPSVPEFMFLSESQRTDQIRRRFLCDPVILLAECRRLADFTNCNPLEALLQAKAAYGFLMAGPGLGWSAYEHAYFQANFALVIGVAEKELGHFGSSSAWLDRTEELCQLANSPEPTQVRIAYMRKALAYQERRWEQALEGIADLKERFAALGSQKYVARCIFVEGIALKEAGRSMEALAKLLELASTKLEGAEGWFRGLALIHAAGIYGQNSQDILADEALATAWELVRDTDVVSAIALFHGMKGEILRDRGSMPASIRSYRLAIAAYSAGRLRASEAYMRVLLAETLLVAGEHREALLETMKALPVIESLGLVREAVVAIALLRKSLAQQEANPEALKLIKLELRRHHGEGQS